MIFNATLQRFLKKYARQQGPVVVFAILFSVFQSLLLLPSIYLIRVIFDQSIPQRDVRGLLIASSLMLVFAVLQTLTGIVHRNVFLKIVKKSVSDLQTDMLNSLITASHEFYNNADRSKIINHTVADVDRTDKLMDALLSVLIPQAVIFSVGVLIIMIYNPMMGLAIVLLGVAGALVQRMMRKKVLLAISDYENAKDDLTGYVSFLPEKHVLTKMRNAETIEMESAMQFSDSLIRKGTAAARRGNHVNTSNELVINISAILLIALGAFQLLAADASFGTIFGIYFLIIFLRRTIAMVQTSWAALHEGLISLERIFHFQDAVGRYSMRPGQGITNFDGSMDVKEVVFSYGGNKVLNGINFHIGPNEIICISGANGGGKSSLINLLLGFYQPNAGEIKTGGVSFQTLDAGAIRARIGYVPQNQVLIKGTIGTNLRYGLAGSSELAIEALQKTGLYRELMIGFDNGLDTAVTENGKNLSNGQMQRISILRALAAEPVLLILDEPANHLDALSIRELVTEIKSQLSISVIVISHHVMFQEIATRSYRLADGKLQVITAHPA